MTTILAVTVSNPQTVLQAVETHHPDHILFVPSEGSRGSRRQVDGPGQPCLVEQLGLSAEQYDIVEGLKDPNDLATAYALCRKKLGEVAQRFPGARAIADYTGGTKTMSVALALAALEAGWDLGVVRGTWANLRELIEGTAIAQMVDVRQVRAQRQLAEARRLFNQYAYASTAALLNNLLAQAAPPPGLMDEIQKRITLTRGLDAWDKFDHETAERLLQSVAGEMVAQWKFLKRLRHEGGYALVLDLLNNAERRAVRGRYDDAVARQYRALELLAQVRLKQRTPSLDASDLDVSLLPEALRPRYEAKRDAKGKIKIALAEDYELLAALGDPLGELYQRERSHLLRVMNIRNNSILAHGLEPISAAKYRQADGLLGPFFAQAFDALGVKLEAPQFPSWPA